ncbi:copper-resistance protein CopA [gamma proteobacterium HTCC5015]|nr:copper-resistance protein CopA [gamma proteobacterium HTCC5015]
MTHSIDLYRRRFVLGASSAAGLSLLGVHKLASAASFSSLLERQSHNGPTEVRGQHVRLSIGEKRVNFTGSERMATVVNNSLPAPTLRFKEGDTVTIDVTNQLSATSSIHWHGIILPTGMDGVPGLSFDGIAPGETFRYQFKLEQSGTYWYHSHSGFQEQTGLYGALVVEPAEQDAMRADVDYSLVLSDWSDDDPEDIYRTLKKLPHFYNRRERTAGDLMRDIEQKGVLKTWRDRSMWNEMRMSSRDISDVTGYTYTFLMNGQTPDSGWVGLFKKGQTVRLRIINAAAMTFFDVRIPGLKMRVIEADGQPIEPVSVDDIRLGVAETYDVLVTPESEQAYTVFAQAIDRSGYARGTLTPDPELLGDIPAMDAAPELTHRDMGMAMMGHDMSHGAHHGGMADHHAHHGMEKLSMGDGRAGFGSAREIMHRQSEFGPHIDMRAEAPQYRLDDPGVGLRQHRELGRKVLTYADLKHRYGTPDPREPDREIQLHLTGNMSRYMWSINGIKFADAQPLRLKQGERVRITLVNDTMMNHPIHLHGMWSDLETGDAGYIPRKHTVIVQPGAKISYLVSADAVGRWAYHCHLLYHMLGMFREVRVEGGTA